MEANRYFLYYFLGFLLLLSFVYVINYILTKSKKNKSKKRINDYLEFLKMKNPTYYNKMKNPNNRDRAFFLAMAMYLGTKGFNFKKWDKVSEYARENNLRDIPLKDVKKIMRRNGIEY